MTESVPRNSVESPSGDWETISVGLEYTLQHGASNGISVS